MNYEAMTIASGIVDGWA